MKKLKAVLVGAGNRGCVYSDYALENPNELEIIAVVDPLELHRTEAGERYGIPADRRFADLADFLETKIKCDFVINATMDEMHYSTAKAIMQAGYNMLLEKPITAKKDELLDLQKIAQEKGVRVNICHVLRYTPFYKRIKELILEGAIGKVLTMELNEHVGIAHFIDSFVRGKWSSEKTCGSNFLLQKSCHDMDLLCWLNNQTTPKYISSLGSRSLFIKENAPQGATEFCYECPHNDTCYYSAQKIHLDIDEMPFQTWASMNKPLDSITREEKAEYLKTNVYGRCAYNSGGDINDRQTVSVKFADGSTAMFMMVGGCCKAGRHIHIVGSKGEIIGGFESGKFILRTFDRSGDKFEYVDTEIDVNRDVYNSTRYSGHGGGDYAIMYETVRYFGGEGASVSVTDINDSVNSHLVVYAAEESRKTNKIIDLNI